MILACQSLGFLKEENWLLTRQNHCLLIWSSGKDGKLSPSLFSTCVSPRIWQPPLHLTPIAPFLILGQFWCSLSVKKQGPTFGCSTVSCLLLKCPSQKLFHHQDINDLYPLMSHNKLILNEIQWNESLRMSSIRIEYNKDNLQWMKKMSYFTYLCLFIFTNQSQFRGGHLKFFICPF